MRMNQKVKLTAFTSGTILGLAIIGAIQSANATDSVPLPPDTNLETAPDVSVTTNTSVYVRNPTLSLVTSSDKSVVTAGSKITYTYTLKNTGNTDYSNIRITDDKCSPITGPTGNDADPNLNQGEVWVYKCSTTVLKDQTNAATVRATPVISTAAPSASPTPSVSPSAPTSTGLKDGTWAGTAPVNVTDQGLQYQIGLSVTTLGGKITGITVPTFTATDPTSKSIGKFYVSTTPSMNGAGNGTLIDEAIGGSTSNVATVSGATYTSAGFRSALQSALSLASV
jgi:uncharacterized protein with FMN-binding domain